MLEGQVIVGGTVSVTVTVDVQVAILPFTSVIVTVTVLGPISEQSKTFGDTLMVEIPQLSLDDDTTCSTSKVTNVDRAG
jgi:hypothetical protein